MELRPLTDLEAGEVGILQAPPEDCAPRRVELGFVARTRVRMVRRGPLGDPVELELRGYRICVRREDVVRLRVQMVREDAS